MYAPNRAPSGSIAGNNVEDGQVTQEKPPKNSTYFGREFTPAQVDAMKGAIGDIYSFMSDNRDKPTITRNGIADTPQPPPPPTNNTPPPPPSGPIKQFVPTAVETVTTTNETTAPVGEKIYPVTAEYVIMMLLVIIVILVYLDYRMRTRVSHMENMIRYIEYGNPHMMNQNRYPMHQTPYMGMGYPSPMYI
ncbi:hypothetical protein EhVM1_000395 [Emiliania huxleyi virus M1]|nr:hypothetical protein EhVM1_000395 [Emiliania huxleyi virus M1]